MATKKKPVHLPRKLSALLTLALDDLEKVEKDSRYSVDMTTWHLPEYGDSDSTCYVCLAGAVMAKSIHASIDADLGPSDFSNSINKSLRALDYLKDGCVWSACDVLGINYRRLLGFDNTPRDIPLYSQDRDGFHRELRKLADDLKESGL